MIVEKIMVKKVNELTDKVAQAQMELEVAQEAGIVTDIAKAEIRLEDAAVALEEYLKKLEKVERTIGTAVTVAAVIGSTTVAIAKTQTAKKLVGQLEERTRQNTWLEEDMYALDQEYKEYQKRIERQDYEQDEEGEEA